MDHIKQEVFNLDGNTQLEFLSRKTLIIIDKERFTFCKQLMLENARDEEFANFLNIPLEKVRYFKYKMQIFEDSIRVRRRAQKLEKERKKELKKKPFRKREISAEERYRQARDLLSKKTYSTIQLSKILKVSERSITRFKQRMRKEKQRLRAEGKIEIDPNDRDDENHFKNLPADQKLKTIGELFKKRLKLEEIANTLKISIRSVRRYRERLEHVNDESVKKGAKRSNFNDWISEDEDKDVVIKYEVVKRTVRASARSQVRSSIKEVEDDVEEEEREADEAQELEGNEGEVEPAPKKIKRGYLDREKIEYAKELMDNKLSNKEMMVLLQVSTTVLRKLKKKILDGTADDLIDNSEEHYTKINQTEDVDPDIDPLHLLEVSYPSQAATTSTRSFPVEKKTKKPVFTDREVFMVRLLRENNIRTMDIAKLMSISERSVTRLTARTKDLVEVEYDPDVVEEVEKLLADKDKILNPEPTAMITSTVQKPRPREAEETKRKIGTNLLAMKVKNKDIAKMLDVSEKTVQRWKARMMQQTVDSEEGEEYAEDDAAYSFCDDSVDIKVKLDPETIIYEEFE